MKLREYLEETGITHRAFARHLGTSGKTLWNILKGGDMKLSMALKIHKLTNYKVRFEDMVPKEKKNL